MKAQKSLISIMTYSAILTSLVFGMSSAGRAQSLNDGYFRVEGYVFDKTTLRPLKNVKVEIRQRTADDGGNMAVPYTDENGLYSAAAPTQSGAVFNTVLAECLTTRGRVASIVKLPVPLRAGEVYLRNLYVQMPRGFTQCQIQ